MLHQFNIVVHVVAGSIAIILGIIAIIKNRNVPLHRKVGTYFKYLLVIVVGTGFLGFLFFRQEPFFLMLTLIAGYVGYAGFRNIQLRENRASKVDLIVALASLGIAVWYGGYVIHHRYVANPVVVYSTLGALVFVISYDLIKYFFLHERLKKWWLYEHIYKVISAFSAMVSAFVGNVFREYHPYSQIGPSLICTILIIYFIVQRARESTRAKR
ncbi:MAG: hypothetical protein HOP30_15400 [Cyclobacteriaceae bacterium]|nr:hypothetical protein [Cyclobacteriaceae bacterium]